MISIINSCSCSNKTKLGNENQSHQFVFRKMFSDQARIIMKCAHVGYVPMSKSEFKHTKSLSLSLFHSCCSCDLISWEIPFDSSKRNDISGACSRPTDQKRNAGDTSRFHHHHYHHHHHHHHHHSYTCKLQLNR